MESSFMVLKEIGSLALEDGGEVKFTLDAYRNYRYASVRKYMSSDSYCGATRAGITMTPQIVAALAPMLEKLPDEPAEIKDGDIGKFAKRPGMSVVARISTFRGARGLDLRQWQEDASYTGWTKKGIRLPLEKIKEIKKLFSAMAAALRDKPLDDF